MINQEQIAAYREMSKNAGANGSGKMAQGLRQGCRKGHEEGCIKNHVEVKMKEKYKGQIEKLSERLKKLNIPHTVKELFDGPDCIKFDWCDADIICHHFSYGGEDGLFEIMGKALMTTMEQKIDSVAGNIPMEDAVNRIKKAWDSNKNEVSKV